MATSSNGRAYAIVLALVVAASAWVLTRPEPLALGGDNAMLEHPVLADAYRQVRAGHLPRWSIGRWGGSPLASDAVIGALYPPYYLGYGLVPFPHLRAIDVIACVHLGVLLAGVVWLMTGLGVGPAGTLVATGLVATNPTLVQIARTWIEYWAALAWWPWLLGAAVRLAAAPSPRYGALAAAALAAQVYAGYPQFALYSGVVALMLIVTGARVPLARRLAIAAVVGAAGVALASPPLLSGLAMARDSTRLGPEHTAALAALDTFALAPGGWLDVVRRSPISPLLPCKLAPVAVALAVLGATTPRPTARVLAGAALTTAVLATRPTTLFHLLHSVPPFSFFAGPVKLFYVTAFLVPVLAGVGVDRLARSSRQWQRAVTLVVAAVALVTSTWFLAGTRALVAPAPFSGGAFAPLLREGPEAIAGGLRAARWLALADGPPLRQVGLNYGSLWDVGSLNGVGPLPAWRQLAVMESADPNAAVALVRQVGADAVVVQAGSRVEATLLEAKFAGPPVRSGLRALRPPFAAAPRFQLAAEATALGPDDMIARARRGEALTSDHADVETTPTGTTWSGDPRGTLLVLRQTPELARMRVRVDRPTWLVARDAHRGGWEATLDGRPAALVPAGGFFQALLVPPGNHEIVVAYEIQGLREGAVVALLALAILPALLALATAPRRVPPATASSAFRTASATTRA